MPINQGFIKEKFFFDDFSLLFGRKELFIIK